MIVLKHAERSKFWFTVAKTIGRYRKFRRIVQAQGGAVLDFSVSVMEKPEVVAEFMGERTLNRATLNNPGYCPDEVSAPRIISANAPCSGRRPDYRRNSSQSISEQSDHRCSLRRKHLGLTP